ncbi:MAG: glucose 1-dehydrogenase [Hyphomicrobiales bacterium]|nr:glucose 1-dehydrogenase [Hyphomicrobiales bacterium]
MLVTGASRGIGAATARMAAAAGYAVVVNYAHNGAAAEALVEEIRADGGTAMAIAADVSDEAAVDQLFAAIDDEFGRLDVLVNNAGIIDKSSRLDEFSKARIDRIFAVNVVGAFLCAQRAVRRMSTRHGGAGGAIVNVSSAAARLGSPGVYIDYAASKGAIDTMTLGLAKEVAGEGIRVNAVRPGYIATDIHDVSGLAGQFDELEASVPMKRSGTAEEVAEAILWLASDAAGYIAGACIDIAGGR